MKFFNTAVIVLLALSAIAVYKSTAQEANYSTRLAQIAEQINRSNLTWTAENPSRFLNVEKSQIMALMGAKMDGQRPPEVVFDENTPAPNQAAFDSRTQWPLCTSIPEIRDQANCGSCWAFGAVEAMSDRICISSGQTLQTRISSQELTSCCSSCGNGCQGGYPSSAWQYFQQSGLVTGDLYGDNTTCVPYALAPCAHHTTSAKYPPCPAVTNTPMCAGKCNPSYGKAYN